MENFTRKIKKLIFFSYLLFGYAEAFGQKLAFSAIPDGFGKKGGIELEVLNSAAISSNHEAKTRIDGFLRAVKLQDCELMLSYVDLAAYRVGQSDQAPFCERFFASFNRFGNFAIDPYIALSDTVLVPLKPFTNTTPYRLLTFRNIAGRWLLSEKVAPSDAAIFFLLASYRSKNSNEPIAPPMIDAPIRLIKMPSKVAAKFQLRMRLVMKSEMSSKASAELMRFYWECLGRDSASAQIEKYLKCLGPESRTEFQKAYDAASVEARLSMVSALTSKRTVDYILVDGSAALIFYTEENTGRRWRDIIYKIGSSEYVLENPMKSGSVDSSLNRDEVRAAIREQAS